MTLTTVFYYFLLFLVLAFLCDWIFRKTKARIQKRYGPLYTGKSGLLQPFADFIKLLSKEDFQRGNIIFEIMPILLTGLAIVPLFFIPVNGKSILSFNGDILFLVFLFDAYTISLLLLGEFSKSRFSRIGVTRQMLLFFSFEIPFIFSIAAFAIKANTLNLSKLGNFSPFLLIAFAVFIISALGKLKRLPFDIGIAEQELVAGYETELSGRKLALLKLSDHFEFLFVAALGSTLLFGPAQSFIGFISKTFVVVFLISFISALFPRYRIDQATRFLWTIIFPLSILGVIVSLI